MSEVKGLEKTENEWEEDGYLLRETEMPAIGVKKREVEKDGFVVSGELTDGVMRSVDVRKKGLDTLAPSISAGTEYGGPGFMNFDYVVCKSEEDLDKLYENSKKEWEILKSPFVKKFVFGK